MNGERDSSTQISFFVCFKCLILNYNFGIVETKFYMHYYRIVISQKCVEVLFYFKSNCHSLVLIKMCKYVEEGWDKISSTRPYAAERQR